MQYQNHHSAAAIGGPSGASSGEEVAIVDSDLEPSSEIGGPSVGRLWRALGAHKWLSCAIVAASIIVALLFLQLSTPTYTISSLVSPTGSQEGQLAQYAQLSSLVGLNLPTSTNVSNYDRFREILKSVALAQRLEAKYQILPQVFPHEWSSAEQEWTPPSGTLSSVRRWIRRLGGMPAWAPPSPKRLAEYVDKNVRVRDLNNSPIVAISVEHKDPRFAAWFLTVLLNEADELVREKEREEVRQNIEYVKEKLGETSVQAYRSALVDILSTLEQRAMLTVSGAAFAAEILDQPTPSDLPTSPNPEMTVALAVVVGIGGALVVAMLLDRRRSRRRYSRNGRNS